jgi:hypothetical protein
VFGRARILLTIAASAVALPAAAQTPVPTTTAFDGTYLGVSRTLEGAMGRTMTGGQMRFCPPSGNGAPSLTIANGNATTKWGSPAEGSVTPQGVLVMRNQSGLRFDGQIDGKGTATGRWTGNCSYQVVWQKKGK